MFITVSSSSPYAVLPMNATAQYISDTPLEGFLKFMIFYCDYTNLSGFIGASNLNLVDEGPPYVYEASITWSPNVTGSHKLIGGVVVSDYMQAIRNAILNGTDIIAQGDVNLNIQRCPSKLVLQIPEAVYNNTLPVVISFSAPRPNPYETKGDGLFIASTLAPQLLYNNMSYVIDEPVKFIPVKFYVDDVLAWEDLTDEYGMLIGNLVLEIPEGVRHFSLKLKGVVDDASILYQGGSVEKIVNFTWVSVRDVGVGNGDFQLNCSVGVDVNGERRIYAGAENHVKVEVNLFNEPLWGVPTSVLIGKPVERDCTNSSGVARVPSSSEFLHVYNLYDINSTSAYAACDITGRYGVPDGIVDMMDISAVAEAYLTEPQDSCYDWRADINFDLLVDMRDIRLCGIYFLETVNYTGILDYSLVRVVFFGGGWRSEAWLDFAGCVEIPRGAIGFGLYLDNQPVGGICTFFKNVTYGIFGTNNVGEVAVSWKTWNVDCYFMRVCLPSTFNVLASSFYNVTQVGAMLSLVDFLWVGKLPISVSLSYAPEQPTLDGTVTFMAYVSESVNGRPVGNMRVNFYIYGINVYGEEVTLPLGYGNTNVSGVIVGSFVPREYYDAYRLYPWFYIEAVCFETPWTLFDYAEVLVDTRYPTMLKALGETVIRTSLGKLETLSCRLVRSDTGETLANKTIFGYLNGTLVGWGSTDENGVFSLDVVIRNKGVYIYQFQFVPCFESDAFYRESENVTFVVFVADVQHVFVFFEVSPSEFEPGDTLTLRAKVLNASNPNQPLAGYDVRFYWANLTHYGFINRDDTDGNGVASVTWQYPFNGVYAVYAVVYNGQKLISSPVMLTVGRKTELTLEVKDEGNNQYTFSGRLLYNGNPVANKQIAFKINGSDVCAVTTLSNGTYYLTVKLKPVNNAATLYRIEAIFTGDEALNFTLYDTAPDGSQYALCTTLQYFGYKPSTATATLTVEPQSTLLLTANKTPEQIQAEAEQSGWLSIWHEWSWWYPWYRLHVKIHVNPTIDIGFNPILPFGEVFSWQGLEIFKGILEEIWEDIMIDFFGLFISYTIAKGLSIWNLVGGLLAEAIKAGLQYGLFLKEFVKATNGSLVMLAVSIANIIMGLVAIATNIAEAFIKALQNIIMGPAISAIMITTAQMISYAAPLRATRTPIDYVDCVVNFSIAILALLKYLGRI